MSTTKTTIAAALVLLLTFAAGFLGGMATHRVLITRRHAVPPMAMRAMVHHLDRRLDLTDAQRTQIEEILRRRHERINAMWAGVRPRVHVELEATNAEIAKVLTPEQRSKFERMRMRLGDRYGRHAGTGQTEPTR